jgi:hypothetical protein
MNSLAKFAKKKNPHIIVNCYGPYIVFMYTKHDIKYLFYLRRIKISFTNIDPKDNYRIGCILFTPWRSYNDLQPNGQIMWETTYLTKVLDIIFSTQCNVMAQMKIHS